MKRIPNPSVLASTVFLVLLASGLSAQEDALSIIRTMQERQKSQTSRAEMSMLVYPVAEDPRNVREYQILSYGRGEEDSYLEFLEPRSIKGLRILAIGNDQWVYFPSTGRVRKIAAKSKQESVGGVGGDFSYEDFSGENMEKKYSFRSLSEDSGAWLIEALPKKADSSYSRLLVTVQKGSYLALKIKFHTRKDGHLKDLTAENIKIISGRPTAMRLIMTNLSKHSRTVLETHVAEYDLPVNDKYFNATRFYQ